MHVAEPAVSFVAHVVCAAFGFCTNPDFFSAKLSQNKWSGAYVFTTSDFNEETDWNKAQPLIIAESLQEEIDWQIM